jgi:predicted DNA-binding protein (MmcQ/YjbR family)
MSVVAQRKAHLAEICGSFPEVETSGDQHLTFQVRKRTFAYYLDNHQGDSRIAWVCKATLADQDFLVRLDPDRFYKAPYLGHRGWIGLHLDRVEVNWDEVHALAKRAYQLMAPKRLVALLDEAGDDS